MLLAHVVMAKVESQVKKVKCHTCGSEHVYRGTTAPVAKPATKRRAAPATIRASDYDLLMKGRDLTRARKYKPAVTFDKNEIVDHPTFGMGIVVKEKDGNKIDVAFRDGLKTLVHRLE
jgi:hypothetical protein